MECEYCGLTIEEREDHRRYKDCLYSLHMALMRVTVQWYLAPGLSDEWKALGRQRMAIMEIFFKIQNDNKRPWYSKYSSYFNAKYIENRRVYFRNHHKIIQHEIEERIKREESKDAQKGIRAALDLESSDKVESTSN